MALTPIIVDKRSPFLGEACALCKQPLAPGDELIVCPEDAARHHSQCWQANGNKCSAYGCRGRGPIAAPVSTGSASGSARPAAPGSTSGSPPPEPVTGEPVAGNQARATRRGRRREREAPAAAEPSSKVRTMPSSNFHCAQSCLLLSIGLAILIFAISCFGLWAIADYIMMEILNWEYRLPLPGLLLVGYRALTHQ
jgi:hypothetical protein